MRRSLLALALFTLMTTACDPITIVRVSIRIRPSAVQAYHGGYPAEVVVREPSPGGDVGYWHLGVLCSAADAQEIFTLGVGGAQCANEVWVDAWLLPAPKGSHQPCGPAAQVGRDLDGPPSSPPFAHVLLMKGVHHVCGNYQSTESFELGSP